MVNNIALDSSNNIIHSERIYRLRASNTRIEARENEYSCPYCHTEMIYAHQGQYGCFKHIPSTPSTIKEGCPYYQGLLSGSTAETALEIESRRVEVEEFFRESNITNYKVISYYSEPKLVRYLETHPEIDFIIIGNRITAWERDNYEQFGQLRLRKKAIAKYIMANRKSVIQTFVGIGRDKIYLMRYMRDFYNDVLLMPYALSVENLRNRDFVNCTNIMQLGDIERVRETEGHHDNRRRHFSQQ